LVIEPDGSEGTLGRVGKRTAGVGGRLLTAGKPAAGRVTEVVGRTVEYRSYFLLSEAAEVDIGGRDIDAGVRVGTEPEEYFFEISACDGIRDTDAGDDGCLYLDFAATAAAEYPPLFWYVFE
jgi:hypothetical protein